MKWSLLVAALSVATLAAQQQPTFRAGVTRRRTPPAGRPARHTATTPFDKLRAGGKEPNQLWID
jgi:hypothetical protein